MLKTLFFILFLTFNSVGANTGKAFLVDQFTVDFEQVFKSSLSGKDKKSSGVINYVYPSLIRFEVLNPDKTLFISNGKKAWYYTAPFIPEEKGEVVVQDASKSILSQFFDSLKQGLVTNKLFKVESKTANSIELKFVGEAAKKMGLDFAKLESSTSNFESFSQITKIILKYQDKKEVTLNFSNFKSTTNLQAKDFDFKIPANTKVTQN